MVFTRSGFEDQYPTAGVRYMAVIDRNNLPVTLAENTVFEGLILDYDKDAGGDVTVLSPSAAGTAPAYKLPNATASALGGVKQAANVANLATSADAAAIVTAVNTLFANLRTAGVMAAK